MSIGKNVGVTAFVVLSSAFVPACGASADPQFVQSEQVTKSTFKGTWPVTADSGVLACDSSKANSVTFTPTDSNTTYAVNGSAMGGWASKEGWADTKTIWNGENWGDFIDAGLKLCGSNS